jgi:hypothetical protein
MADSIVIVSGGLDSVRVCNPYLVTMLPEAKSQNLWQS